MDVKAFLPIDNSKKSFEDFFKPCIVAILLKRGSEKEIHGTGFLISQIGHILTCYHVIESLNPNKIFVQFYNDDIGETNLLEHMSSESKDFAILKTNINKDDFPYLDLSNQYSIKDEWCSLGYGLCQNFKEIPLSGNIDSKIFYQNNSGYMIKLNANSPITRGYSGSPIIHKRTQSVIGVISLQINIMDKRDGLAIPIEEIFTLIPDIKRINKENKLKSIKISQNQYNINSNEIKNLKELGISEFKKKEFQKAEKYFNKILEQNVQDYYVHFLKSCCIAEQYTYEDFKILQLEETFNFIRTNYPAVQNDLSLDKIVNYYLSHGDRCQTKLKEKFSYGVDQKYIGIYIIKMSEIISFYEYIYQINSQKYSKIPKKIIDICNDLLQGIIGRGNRYDTQGKLIKNWKYNLPEKDYNMILKIKNKYQ
jgi:hypothetical protein